MKTYIIGPSGTYFSIEESFIVRVDDDSDFEHLMDIEDIDEAWAFVIDSIPGPQLDARIGWAVCDNMHYNASR